MGSRVARRAARQHPDLTGAPVGIDDTGSAFRVVIFALLALDGLISAVCGAFLLPVWLGGVAGMTLHFFLNFPIFLARRDVFGLGETWLPVLALWSLGYAGGCAIMTFAIARRTVASAKPG